MVDKEKVIKGLESLRDICNAKSNMAIGNGKVAWAGYANTADDAISMLKEQEPRILGWDEIKNYSVVYGEFKDISEIYPLIITYDSKGRALSWNPCINRKEEYLLLTYDKEDRKNTRCWNKMPTAEQRKAARWDE